MIKRKTSVLFRNQKRCLNSTMNIKLQPLTYVLAWSISVHDPYIQNMTCEPYSGDFKNSHSACISSFHRIPVCVCVCVCVWRVCCMYAGVCGVRGGVEGGERGCVSGRFGVYVFVCGGWGGGWGCAPASAPSGDFPLPDVDPYV